MEVLCGFELLLKGVLPFIEQIMTRCDWALVFSLIPTWALLAWAWRDGRLRIAWLAAAYPLSLLAWDLGMGVLWLTQGQGSLRVYIPICSC